MRVLVVEDESVSREIVAAAVRALGHDVVAVATGEEGWEYFESEAELEIVISDWFLPGLDGLELCRRIRAAGRSRYTYFILLTSAAGGREEKIDALTAGADDFLTKPLDRDALEVRLIVGARVAQLQQTVIEVTERITALEEESRRRSGFQGIVGKCVAMQEVFRRIRLAAGSEVNVFVQGESGTGKELAASAIHALSDRRDQPFVAVNCAAIPETILESELFGHVRGAFTGAHEDKEGLVEAARGGTLFLDEIGDLGLDLQKKLLRFLQERKIRRVGDAYDREVDVRIVSATHRDLKTQSAEGAFREDLYYRLCVFQIDLPALRERTEDIPLLVEQLIARLREKTGRSITRVEPAALAQLVGHPWPGNVRELQNALEHAFVMATPPVLTLADLPREIREVPAPSTSGERASAETADRADRAPVESAPSETEAEEVVRVVHETGGNRAEAARRLGISRVALWKKIRRLDLEAELPASRRGRPPATDAESR